MAATVLVHGAGDRPVLLRPEGVRRGRHAHGGEGMKLAVIGGGLDVHARARRRARARARPAGRSTSSCCTTSRPSGATSSARSPGGCSPRDGLRRRAGDHRRPRPRASTAPTSCSSSSASAARRRGCRDETVPARRAAASGRRRPAPAASPRRCGRCRSCSTSPSACASAPRRRRLDRRLHQPGRDRHPRAARRGPPRGRAVQRGDRLPARAWRGMLGVDARARGRRPGRPQPPDLGARGAARRRGRAAGAARRARRRARRRGRAAAPAARRARRRAVVLPALLLRARRGGRRAAHGAVPRAQRVAEIERELLAHVPRPGAEREAGAARAARRRVLQRGGDAGSSRRSSPTTGDVHVVDVRNDGTLPGLADDDVVEVPARVGRSGPVRAAAAAAGARAARARPARRRVRAARGPGGAARAIAVVARKALLAHPLIGQHAIAWELVERLLDAGAQHLPAFEPEAVR